MCSIAENGFHVLTVGGIKIEIGCDSTYNLRIAAEVTPHCTHDVTAYHDGRCGPDRV